MTRFVFDGDFMLHRSLAVNPERGFMEFNGQITGGIYNFLRSLQVIVSGANPDEIIIAWDGKISGRRRKLLPEYKKNRVPKTAEEIEAKKEFREIFNEQKQILQTKFLPALGVMSITMPHKEGDDVIHQICEATCATDNIVVVTEDKDLLQLVQPFENVKVYLPIKEKLIGRENFLDESDVPPEVYLLFRAIVGDKSDNIAGVSGIGKVTAKKILDKMDIKNPVESLLQYGIKESEKKKLQRGAKINSQWGTIARNLELMDLAREEFSNNEIERMRTEINNFKFGTIYREYFENECRNFGFNRILNDLGNWFAYFGSER